MRQGDTGGARRWGTSGPERAHVEPAPGPERGPEWPRVAGRLHATMERGSLIDDPIGPALLRLAWPVIAGEALHTAFHLVDIAWVGPLGAWATGAIMTSMFTLWIAFALMNLVSVGLSAHVSQAVGAGRADDAGRMVALSLWLAALLSLPAAALRWFGAGSLFRLLVDDVQVANAGAAYLRVVALGLPLSFISTTLAAAMRACGNTRTPLLIGAAAVLANIALAPLFVYGLGPIPAMGVTGSAIATLICQLGAMLAALRLAAARRSDLPVDRASLRRPDLRAIRDIARVGAPYFFVGALFSAVYLYYAHLAGAFGAAAIAVLGIGNRIESITYLSADGFAVAASVFVGQNLGAGDPDRAERGAWRAAWIMSAAAALMGLVLLAIPEPFVAIFTRDPEALALGVSWLRVLAACQVFTGLEGVIGGGFAGAGDTIPPTIIHVVFAILRVPLAWWAVMGLGMGPMGIVWTMTLTCIARGIIVALWFRRGAWKTKRLSPAPAPLPAAEGPDSSSEAL